jgi:hypothetical protein
MLKITKFAKNRKNENFFIFKETKIFVKFNFKNFGKKYKTVIKPIKNDTDNNPNNTNTSNTSSNNTQSFSPNSFFNKNPKEETTSNDYKIKPEFKQSRKSDDSGLNIMSKFDDKKIQNFYSDLRNTAMNLEDSGVKRMYLWYGAHILPSLCFIPNFFNFVFVYQIFWISSSMGLAYSSYEFYSTPKEKRILDNHIRLGYLMCMGIIVLAVAYKLNKDEGVKQAIEIINSVNFLTIYAFFAFKRREFYIPIWLKHSMRLFLPFMMIISLGISGYKKVEEKSCLKVSDEQVGLIQQRYLREFSSKFM